LGVLVSVFSATVFAESCQVKDAKLFDYEGECLDGFAHGKGKVSAKTFTYVGEFKYGVREGKGVSEGNVFLNKMEKFIGEFKDGKRNGRGVLFFRNGSKFEGNYLNDMFNGFGKFTFVSDDINIKEWGFDGKWEGNKYIAEGIFKDDDLILSCSSPQNCKQIQAKREVQERREASEREAKEKREAIAREAQERREAADRERDRATACNKYYNGYVGYVDYNNGKKSIWGQDIGNKYGQFVVLGSGGGNVSIKGTDNGSYPGYNNMDNVSCTWLREKER
jgi:MORN repeat